MRSLLLLPMLLINVLALPAIGWAASLEISPASGTFEEGEVVMVSILLNTNNHPIDGVDIHYLTYDPLRLQVLDADPQKEGIQITPGTLMPVNVFNEVYSQKGQIAFSQLTAGGQRFKNNHAQPLATFQAKVLEPGTTQIRIDFVPGNTKDSNVVAFAEEDLLERVQNAHYTAVSSSWNRTSFLSALGIIIITGILLLGGNRISKTA